MSDIVLMSSIIVVFILLGAFIPYVNSEFGIAETDFNVDGLSSDVGQADVSGLDVLLSVLSMFFWTFGTLPFWLDAIFEVFRVMLYIIIVRTIRGVG